MTIYLCSVDRTGHVRFDGLSMEQCDYRITEAVAGFDGGQDGWTLFWSRLVHGVSVYHKRRTGKFRCAL